MPDGRSLSTGDAPGAGILEAPSSRETLALLYQGILTGIVRIQAKRQEVGPPEPFRKRMLIALKEVERDALALQYSPEDVKDAEFAVVAFLDEAILNSNDPSREEWAKKTLSVELFREAQAGEVFFERLESYRTRRDSRQLADLLEVFLTCLLLGFEGRYADLRGDLQAISDRTYRRIQSIRPIPPGLSSAQQVRKTEQPSHPPAPPDWRLRVLLVALSGVLFFLVLKIHLVWSIAQLKEVAEGLR